MGSEIAIGGLQNAPNQPQNAINGVYPAISPPVGSKLELPQIGLKIHWLTSNIPPPVEGPLEMHCMPPSKHTVNTDTSKLKSFNAIYHLSGFLIVDAAI